MDLDHKIKETMGSTKKNAQLTKHDARNTMKVNSEFCAISELKVLLLTV